jgi:hypothetical protein
VETPEAIELRSVGRVLRAGALILEVLILGLLGWVIQFALTTDDEIRALYAFCGVIGCVFIMVVVWVLGRWLSAMACGLASIVDDRRREAETPLRPRMSGLSKKS